MKMTRENTDIINRCREGDPKAQFLLYKNFSKAMYNIAIRFLNNNMDAEDILQESFVKAFENIKDLEDSRAFGSWLKRIVINNCLTQLRKNKIYFEEITDYNFEDQVEENIFESIDPTYVHKAIKDLPEGSRTILILHALEGYKHREVAAMLNISESTSRTQYKRALSLLNKSLTRNVYVN
ncbi:MAG: sigma-70 family RNA polymerase sigma factor [Bacteroidales bacterium]|nr:sigma-70 family RNA polymerase sigma factor [Bacteroidales bacterium]